MRIVAGSMRGRVLETPSGQGTRPTSERAREALFNILAHRDIPIQGARIADIFAGSGALGFEALSRGAAAATFVEKDNAALRALYANAQKLGVADRISILPVDARFLLEEATPFQYLFMDPPYKSGLAFEILPLLLHKGWIASESLAIVEIAAKEKFVLPESFEVVDDRKYGAARLLFVKSV